MDGVPLYTDPLREITDQIGVRVITYVHSDVAAVADLLGDQVVVLDDRDMGQETAQRGPLRLRQPAPAGRPGRRRARATAAYDALRGRRAQVQVRTVLQHAWAEFEHDIRYKGTIPDEHVPDLDRRFTLAAGLLELADREFSTIRDRLAGRRAASAAEPDVGRRPADQPARARGVPGRAVRRRRLVAHRPLRLDLRAAARARASPRSTSSARLLRAVDSDAINDADGLPLPARRRPPARRRAARRFGAATSTCTATRTAVGPEARLERMLGPAVTGSPPGGLTVGVPRIDGDDLFGSSRQPWSQRQRSPGPRVVGKGTSRLHARSTCDTSRV